MKIKVKISVSDDRAEDLAIDITVYSDEKWSNMNEDARTIAIREYIDSIKQPSWNIHSIEFSK